MVSSVEKLGENGKVSFFFFCGESTAGLFSAAEMRRLPAPGPMFSPLRHSWRMSWLPGHSADGD